MDAKNDVPFKLMEIAKLAVSDVLPTKSKEKYNKVYGEFKDWQNKNGAKTIALPVVMAYFYHLAKKYKPSSLWAYYSMLKATLRCNEDVDIGTYPQVTAFLKTKASGYRPIKAEVFSEENIKKFIQEAADLQWLDVKVVMIFGVSGALRSEELVKIEIGDVEKHSDLFLVRVLQTKTNVIGSFTISGTFFTFVQKYIDLRPANAATKRFFVNYQRGKCTKQVIGKTKISKMPQRVAEFLQLPMASTYAGHSFRRTSATVLANSGADMDTIMTHGAWRNQNCAKGYVEDSLSYKLRTGNMITSSITGEIPSSVHDPNSSSLSSSHGAGVSIAGQSLCSSLGAGLSVAGQSLPSTHGAGLPIDGQCSSSVNKTDIIFFDTVNDCPFDDIDLVQICDASVVASQMLQEETVMPTATSSRSAQNNSETRTALTQSITSNSLLNSIHPDAFKILEFKTLNNCTFNINIAK